MFFPRQRLNGHLSKTDTSQRRTPLKDGHLSKTDNHTKNGHLKKNGHLSKPHTSQRRTPLKHRHLSKTDNSLRRTCTIYTVGPNRFHVVTTV